MKLNIFGAVQKGVQGIKLVQKVLKALDKLDDDLDGDGKSQLQNICEKAEELIGAVIHECKDVLRQLGSVVNVIKLQGGEIMAEVSQLADHVLKEGK